MSKNEPETIVINKKYLTLLNDQWRLRCAIRGTFVNDNTVHPSVKYLNNSIDGVVLACRKQFDVNPNDVKHEK